MIIGEQELAGTYLKGFRKKLDEAVLNRLIACGKLEPYSVEWDEAYHEASKSIFALRDEARAHLWKRYKTLWGKNATGSYFQPAHTFNREERMSVYRVSQKLALASIEKKK
jgi:hypothetical protein